jgi:hypothetical protein
VETVATTLEADWVMLHDADERRRPPWPDASLRNGLYAVDRRGFTCVDHTTINHWPTSEAPFRSDRPLEDQLPFAEFSCHPGHFLQRRAWKNVGPVSLAPTAGHDVSFCGRRVFPYRFLLHHYPIRSREHGRRKIICERQARWNKEERQLGWHRQYDELTDELVRPLDSLLHADCINGDDCLLLERLTGVGVFDAPPTWCTPPLWGRVPVVEEDGVADIFEPAA